MLMEKFCAISNVLGSVVVNEIKGIVYLLTERQFQALEGVGKASKQAWDGHFSGKPRVGESYSRKRSCEVGQMHVCISYSEYFNALLSGLGVLIVQRSCEINFGISSFNWLNSLRTFLLRKQTNKTLFGQNLGQKDNPDTDGRLCHGFWFGVPIFFAFSSHDFHIRRSA